MILVTGATGQVGAELVLQLLEQDQPVRVFTRDARKVAHLGSRVEVATGDYDQPETLTAAMQGIEKLYLMTSEIGADQAGTATEAAKQAGVKQIVLLSSYTSVNPATAIGKWHYDREQHVRASGIPWTFLRPGFFASNALMQWANMIKTMGTIYYPGGQSKVAPIDPYDIAAVAALALTQIGHEGQTYTLTGAELLTIEKMVEILARALGKPLHYVDVPQEAAREGMMQSGMDATLADAVLELVAEMREGQVLHTETVEQLLGRAPRTFAQWCEAHVAAFQ
jgi:uncharacterized protein YbjT (DUF2867 family)